LLDSQVEFVRFTRYRLVFRFPTFGAEEIDRLSEKDGGRPSRIEMSAPSLSFEPGFDFPFPEGDVPASLTLGGRALSAITASHRISCSSPRIPMIVIYYGDNIPGKPSTNPGQEQWRIFLEMAKKWRDVVNRHSGDVTLVHLPEIAIRGNTHFPMCLVP
jgi:hypothetical protein